MQICPKVLMYRQTWLEICILNFLLTKFKNKMKIMKFPHIVMFPINWKLINKKCLAIILLSSIYNRKKYCSRIFLFFFLPVFRFLADLHILGTSDIEKHVFITCLSVCMSIYMSSLCHRKVYIRYHLKMGIYSRKGMLL